MRGRVHNILFVAYYLFYLGPTSFLFFSLKYFTFSVDISPLSGFPTTRSYYILYVYVFTIIFFNWLTLIIIIIIVIVCTIIFTLSHDKTSYYQFVLVLDFAKRKYEHTTHVLKSYYRLFSAV